MSMGKTYIVRKQKSVNGSPKLREYFKLWRYYCSKSNPILYLNVVRCKFLLCRRVELSIIAVTNHFGKLRSTQDNLHYLSLVCVTMVTGTYFSIEYGVLLL